jgi:(p)ppGpp synthase/HD superfamily hydrolase
MEPLSDKFIEALIYSARLHAGQLRKGTQIPYFSHLMGVTALVLKEGGTPTEAIAALLHDALEDQPKKTSREEIRARFGEEVLDLVVANTDTPADYKGGPKPPWRARKEAYINRLAEHSQSALRIAIADKLDNLRDLLADYREKGDILWSNFHAGKEDYLWYYQACVKAFEQAQANGRNYEEFKASVTEFIKALGK